MSNLPCICCENGQPSKHVICETCNDILEKRVETFELMVGLVKEINELSPFSCNHEIEKEVRDKTLILYDLLCEIKIEKKSCD